MSGLSKLDLYLAALALGLEFKALEIKSLVHGLGWELVQKRTVYVVALSEAVALQLRCLSVC